MKEFKFTPTDVSKLRPDQLRAREKYTKVMKLMEHHINIVTQINREEYDLECKGHLTPEMKELISSRRVRHMNIYRRLGKIVDTLFSMYGSILPEEV
jgi:hypothetical protein